MNTWYPWHAFGSGAKGELWDLMQKRMIQVILARMLQNFLGL
jgi:hypothetical protein